MTDMDNSHKRIYIIYLLFSTVLFTYAFLITGKVLNPPGEYCLFRSLFYIPCVGCGGSHAIKAFMNGNIITAFEFNAFISILYIIAILIIIILFVDMFMTKNYLLKIHTIIKNLLREKKKAYVMAWLLILFWVYHIAFFD